MTPQKAAALLPIFSAFAHGKTIQYQVCDGSWQDIHDPDFSGAFYRVKPDPIILKYRRYIWKEPNGYHIASVSSNSGLSISDIEYMDDFVWWIDKDWISYECEV